MRARGLTIIELLLATALLALFMGAALHVVRGLGRSSRVLAERRLMHGGADPMAMMRFDLANARSARIDKHRLALAGYGAIDAETHRVQHRPVEVVYEVRSDGVDRWLVRQQTVLGTLRNRSVSAAPLAAGVGELGFEIPKAVRTLMQRRAKAMKHQAENQARSAKAPDDGVAVAGARAEAGGVAEPEADIFADNPEAPGFSTESQAKPEPAPKAEASAAPDRARPDPLIGHRGFGPVPPRLTVVLTYGDGRPTRTHELFVRPEEAR